MRPDTKTPAPHPEALEYHKSWLKYKWGEGVAVRILQAPPLKLGDTEGQRKSMDRVGEERDTLGRGRWLEAKWWR